MILCALLGISSSRWTSLWGKSPAGRDHWRRVITDHVNLQSEYKLWLKPTDHIRRRPENRSNANKSNVDIILISGISTSTSGRSIQTNMVTPQRFLANSIYTGVHTERQIQFGFCAFNRILRHCIIWAFLPLMSRCSKSIHIKSPTTIIQLWAMYAIVVIYLGNLTHITDRGFMQWALDLD
jgi:hypothetical protein